MGAEQFNLLGAFLLGLAGSPHCLGMCGGISSLTAKASGDSRHSATRRLGFQLGRIGSYTLLGAVLGAVGSGLSQQWLPVGTVFRALASILLIMMAVSIAGWFPATRGIERLGAGLWRRVQPFTRRLLPADTLGKSLALGSLWGLLPCGLIYSALAWATLSAHPLYSALLMGAFGLGTLPAMLGISQLQGGVLQKLKQPLARTALAAMMIGLAIAPLLRLYQPHQHQPEPGMEAGSPHQHHHPVDGQ